MTDENKNTCLTQRISEREEALLAAMLKSAAYFFSIQLHTSADNIMERYKKYKKELGLLPKSSSWLG